MKHRNDDLLFAIAFGDAAAVATEYVDKREYPELFEAALRLDGFYAHPRHTDTIPGRYGDDGQMSVAVAEVLTHPDWIGNGHPTQLHFADSFVKVFRRDPRPGYARNFYEFLKRTYSGRQFLVNIRPHSEKNGAAMRAVPIGVFADPTEVVGIAHVQASVTHNTPIGLTSAAAVALMSQFALYKDDEFSRLPEYLEQFIGQSLSFIGLNLRKSWHGEVHQPATNTLHAVIELLRNSQTISEVLRGAIRLGGDTDTVAAIAVGIASSRMPFDISDEMIAQFEPFGKYGATFLKELGKKLMDTFNTTTE